MLGTKTVFGVPVPSRVMTCAAAGTVGDLVYSASGKATIVAAGGAKILGRVLNSTTAADQEVQVELLYPGVRVNMLLTDQDEMATAATRLAIIGKAFNLVGTTGAQTVDTSSTGGTPSLKLVDLIYDYNRKVWVGQFEVLASCNDNLLVAG